MARDSTYKQSDDSAIESRRIHPRNHILEAGPPQFPQPHLHYPIYDPSAYNSMIANQQSRQPLLALTHSEMKGRGYVAQHLKGQRMNLRRGKWSPEEEAYTIKIIQNFSTGVLQLPEGTTLRVYLAEKLHCDPMRITKKFTGSSCLGKRVYHSCERTPASQTEIEESRKELERLEVKFFEQLQRKSNRTVIGNPQMAGIPLTNQSAEIDMYNRAQIHTNNPIYNPQFQPQTWAANQRALYRGYEAPFHVYPTPQYYGHHVQPIPYNQYLPQGIPYHYIAPSNVHPFPQQVPIHPEFHSEGPNPSYPGFNGPNHPYVQYPLMWGQGNGIPRELHPSHFQCNNQPVNGYNSANQELMKRVDESSNVPSPGSEGMNGRANCKSRSCSSSNSTTSTSSSNQNEEAKAKNLPEGLVSQKNEINQFGSMHGSNSSDATTLDCLGCNNGTDNSNSSSGEGEISNEMRSSSNTTQDNSNGDSSMDSVEDEKCQKSKKCKNHGKVASESDGAGALMSFYNCVNRKHSKDLSSKGEQHTANKKPKREKK